MPFFSSFLDKLRTQACKANRDILNAERGMLILEQRKLFYKNRDRLIREKTDQLERELTGVPDEDIQPLTEFLKTAIKDNPEYYQQNDFIEADAVLGNGDFLLEVLIFFFYFRIVTAYHFFILSSMKTLLRRFKLHLIFSWIQHKLLFHKAVHKTGISRLRNLRILFAWLRNLLEE